MSLQRSHNIDLSSRAVSRFICASTEQSYIEPISIPAGYARAKTADRSSGRVSKDEAGKNLSAYCFVREIYDVIEGSKGKTAGTVVNNISADICVQQDIAIETFSSLLLRTDLDESSTKSITGAFDNFPATGSESPDDYMSKFLRSNIDISSSMFRVVLYCVVYKEGDPIAHTHDRDAKLGVYAGTAQGEVWNENGDATPISGESGYFRNRNMDIRLVRTQRLEQIPTEDRSPYEIQVQDSSVYKTFDNIINSEAEAIGCSAQHYEIRHHRIATLLRFPEFKIEFRNFVVEIGCGIYISITLPTLQIRWSNLDLHSILRFPRDLGQIAVDAFVDCAWKAALAGAVIGVAFGNFAAAVIAFKSLFSDCLKNKFKQFIACMIPNLGLNTVVTEDWSSV